MMRWRGAAAAGAAAVVLLAASPAHAFVTTILDGGAEAQVADRAAAAGVRTVVEATGLYPTKAALATVEIANPGSTGVIVTSISAGLSPASGGCAHGTVSSVGLASSSGVPQVDGVTRRIAAGGVGRYPISVFMSGAAEGACIGQVFSIPVTVQTELAP